MPLFSRSHKRLRMTAAAEYLAQVAERAIADLVRAEQDAERMGRGVRHVVRLAVEAYSSYHWLPRFLRHLKAQSPDTGIQVVAAAARRPRGRPSQGPCPAVFCWPSHDFPLQPAILMAIPHQRHSVILVI